MMSVSMLRNLPRPDPSLKTERGQVASHSSMQLYLSVIEGAALVVVHSCLQLRLIRHEWGASFFDVGVSLKNFSCCLQRTKPCGSFDPKVDKLTAGGSSPIIIIIIIVVVVVVVASRPKVT